MNWLYCLVVVVCGTSPLTHDDRIDPYQYPVRTWTSTDGRGADYRFLRFDKVSNFVYLESEGGEIRFAKLERFCQADRELVFLMHEAANKPRSSIFVQAEIYGNSIVVKARKLIYALQTSAVSEPQETQSKANDEMAQLMQYEKYLEDDRIPKLEGDKVQANALNQTRLSLAIAKAKLAVLMLRSSAPDLVKVEKWLRSSEAYYRQLDPSIFTHEDNRVDAEAQSLSRLALLELTAVVYKKLQQDSAATKYLPPSEQMSPTMPQELVQDAAVSQELGSCGGLAAPVLGAVMDSPVCSVHKPEEPTSAQPRCNVVTSTKRCLRLLGRR